MFYVIEKGRSTAAKFFSYAAVFPWVIEFYMKDYKINMYFSYFVVGRFGTNPDLPRAVSLINQPFYG